ncbi:MAG TPA: leucyl aminopeptidase family protein, partial [Acetobacteraceae bacterium]|nr:leucyl aminopeptidase family protein [Acetobacteraceae bacterium]
ALLEEMPDDAAAFLRASGFAARLGAVALVPGRNGIKGAVLGLGDGVGPAAFGALPFGLPEGVVCRFAGPLDSPEDAVLGFCLGAYRFSQLKTRQERAPARLVPPAACGHAAMLASTAWLVRDLINLPANLLGPRELAEAAVAALQPFGAVVEIIEGETLSSSYPMVAAVGAGAARPPLVVRARGGAADASAKLISLVGKGVCFDTGGYDLKPSSGMQRMKKDMAGAAIALGIARLLLACQIPVRLELRLGCVENSVSGNAMRPLDVLRSRRGLTVAVANTDAEGRLVLADLLAEASDAEPDMLLDFATLTGAARTALGPDIAALFSNDDDMAAEIETAARAAHEAVWRMPLHEAYDFYLDGIESDLKNISDKPYAGAVMAALFLQRFLAPGTKWAHFDLFGWNETTRPGRPEGGEAQCMRTAFELVARAARRGKSQDEGGMASAA